MFQDIDTICTPYNHYIHFYTQDKNVNLYFVQLGYHCTPSGHGFGPLIRDHYLIHFIKSGSGFLIINNRKYTLSEGECFLISPNQIAYYESDSTTPLEYYWLGFSGYQSLSYIIKSGFNPNIPIKSIYFKDEIFSEFTHILSLGCSKQNFLAYQGFLFYILFYLSNSPNIPVIPPPSFTYIDTSKSSKMAYIQQVVDIIQSSYQCEIIVEEIAKKLSLNHSYLCKIFKESMGCSIKQYLINYRLNISSILLKSPHKTIGEVALEVGFKDPLYFSKVFHKKYNMSPTKYRNELIH